MGNMSDSFTDPKPSPQNTQSVSTESISDKNTNTNPGQAPPSNGKTLDSKERQRGQRFLGVLMGTLSKFQTESQKKSEALAKREQINQKLQEKLQKEKEEIKAKIEAEKKQRLAWQEEANKEKQKREIERVAELKRKDEASRCHFISTSTEPKLFYLPRKLLPELDSKLTAQKSQFSENSPKIADK